MKRGYHRLTRKGKARRRATRRKQRGGGPQENAIQALKHAGRYNDWVARGSMWGAEAEDLSQATMVYTNAKGSPVQILTTYRQYPVLNASQQEKVRRILPVFDYIPESTEECSTQQIMKDMLEAFGASIGEQLGPGFVSMGDIKTSRPGQGALYTFGLDPCLALSLHIGSSVLMTHLHALSDVRQIQAEITALLEEQGYIANALTADDLVVFGEGVSINDPECGRSIVLQKIIGVLEGLGLQRLVPKARQIVALESYQQCVVDPDSNPWYRIEDRKIPSSDSPFNWND